MGGEVIFMPPCIFLYRESLIKYTGRMTNGFAAHGPGMPPGRPKRWAATGGAPQLAVHGAWRFEWADQMMEVVLRAISDRHFRKNDRKPGIKWLSCMVELYDGGGPAIGPCSPSCAAYIHFVRIMNHC